MALADPTYTIAGLRAELTAFSAALEGNDFDTAGLRASRYYAVRTGLVDVVSADGLSVNLAEPPNPDLWEQIEKKRELAARSGSRGRRVLGRTSFGRSRSRGGR